MAAQWAVDHAAACQGVARPMIETGDVRRRPGMAAERSTHAIEGKADCLAVPEATVKCGEQQACVKRPGY